MSQEQPPRVALPPITLGALLGFRDGADPAEWGRIRATQLSEGRKLALFLLGANLVGAAIVVMLVGHDAPL